MIRALLLLSLVGALGCSGAAADQRVVVTGSSTVAPLMSDIARRFEAQNPGARVDVQTGGSARGIADARGGVADIGMVSRALKPEERDLRATPIARDGLALIVHEDNPVTALSAAQVAAIYTGAVSDWREVGGAPGKITVVHKAEGRSTLELFLEHFEMENARVRPSVVIGDNEQGIKTVAGNPGAIGYVSVGVARIDQQRGTAIKPLPLSLTRELNLVTRGEPTELARRVLDFARSPDVADLLERHAVEPAR
jgi:phosphate transport system substrate-binding protein